MKPRWMLLVAITRRVWAIVNSFGPDFSDQVWSIVWLAIVCPRRRLTLGRERWMIEGKNPSILEKW